MPLTKGPSGLLRRFNMSSLIFLDSDTSTQENTKSTELSTFFRKRLGKRSDIDSENAVHVAYTGWDAGDESVLIYCIAKSPIFFFLFK
jgi:hypothetical protein